MGGGGQSTQTSLPQYSTLPNVYGTSTDYSKSAQFARGAERGLKWKSQYEDPLAQALLHPEFGPTSEADQNMLNSLMDITAGRGAVRGLGSPTQSSLAQAVAPELLRMQEGQIQGLMGARGLDMQQQGMNMQTLLELAGLAMPQTIGGTASTGTSNQYGWLHNLGGLFG